MNLRGRKVSSFVLFTLLVLSILFTLPIFDFTVSPVVADSTNSGFNFFTNSIEVSGTPDGTWKEIDVSAYVPGGSSGAIVEIQNEYSSARTLDIRAKGSTDSHYYNVLWGYCHKYAVVKLDASAIFEFKAMDTFVHVYLIGYTDDSVVYETNGVDYQLGVATSWETIDVSADVPEGATGVIFRIIYDGQASVGLQHPDSTDDMHGLNRGWLFAFSGINSAREVEGYVSTTNADHYLMGYTTSPITFLTNKVDKSLGSTGSYIDIDVTGDTEAGANGVIVWMDHTSGNWKSAIREDGSTDDRYDDTRLYTSSTIWGLIGLGAGEIFESKIEDLACDIYIVGYTKTGTVYPINQDVVSTSEFAINQTIGWINASVTHADGYANIESVIATVSTTGGAETCNLTWVQSTDTFTESYDPDNIIRLFPSDSESSCATTWCNVSFKVAFLGGTAGYCDVTLFTTAIDDYTDSDTYSNEFFLSEMIRASGIKWTKDLGYFPDYLGVDPVDISEDGNRSVVYVQSINDMYMYDTDGNLLLTWDAGGNVSASSNVPHIRISGDGNYILVAVKNMHIGLTGLNVTLINANTGANVWSYYYADELIHSKPAINYNGSISILGTGQKLRYFDLTGLVWTCTTMRGQTIPSLRGLSVSRNGDLIASGCAKGTSPWGDGALFVWTTASSEPIWSWNISSTPQFAIRSTGVSDDGLYVASSYNPVLYSTTYVIHSYSSSTPLIETDAFTFIGVGIDDLDFVAESGKDEFYLTAFGDYSASNSKIQSHKYNVTSGVWTNIWNYSSVSANVRDLSMSKEMKDDRYYFCTTGDAGVYYWDTSTNTSIWSYYNATHDIGYNIEMDRDGNCFFASAMNVGSDEKFVQYYGYVDVDPFQVDQAIITNMEGCGAWVFADERYYHFRGDFSHIVDATSLHFVGLRFSDGSSTFYLWYNVSARSEPNIDAFSLEISPQFDPDKDPGSLHATNSQATFDEGDLTVIWDLWFTSFSFDELDIDIYAYMNDTIGNEIDWTIESSDYFNIYVLGGQTESESSGDAGQYQDVSPYNLYASNGSSVYVETYYRKLQHVNFQYGIWMPDAYVNYPYNYTLDMGLDWCFYGDDYWYNGFKTQIQQHGGGSTVTNRWTNYTVEHYRFNPTGGGSYEPMRQGKMYAYWEGYDSGSDQYQLYTDLWFSSSNRSRMWGARVNSVYFGMVDNALFGLPWLFGSNWRTMSLNFTDLAYKDMIMDYPATLDAWGDERYSTEIVMVRFWMNLSRPQGDPFYVRVQGYTSQDFSTIQSGQFVGINDPPLVPTMVVSIDSGGGLFGSLASWLWDLGSRIVEGLTTGILAGWGIFVSFLDTVFSYAGWENGFSVIISWVSSLIDWVIIAFTYLFDLLTSLFSLMTTWLVLGIQRFVEIGAGLTVIYTNLVWIYEEANAGWVDISPIVTALLPLLPFAFFVWILNSNDIEHVFRKLSMCWTFIRSIAGFFIQIGQYVVQLISSIIEAIPVAE